MSSIPVRATVLAQASSPAAEQAPAPGEVKQAPAGEEKTGEPQVDGKAADQAAPGEARTEQPQTTQPQPAPSPGGGVGPWIGAGVVAALALLFVYALARKRAARRKELQEPGHKELGPRQERLAQPPSAPLEKEVLVQAPRRRVEEKEELSEAGLAAARAADEAKRADEAAEAARLEAKRLLEEARKGSEAALAQKAEEARESARRAREEAEAARARAEAEARRRDQELEERKKEEYRQRRAQEAAEKEQRRLEAEQARQRALEQARLAEEEAQAARQRAEEEQRRKVQAEAGKTLSEGLARTRGGFMAGLNSLLGRGKVLDESVIAELEEVLFSADIGLATATHLLEFARDRVKARDLDDPEKLKDAIRQEIGRIVAVNGAEIDQSAHHPHVMMVVGVNGSGKTTTIGKLAAKLTSQGKKVVLAAGDTFRAAATEQLEVWGERSGTPVVKGKEGSDPGAVVFDAIKRAQTEQADVVLCDTAGRLHTQAPLMEELKRVKRVMDKAMPGAPHEILLVLDATNGQNAIAQAREFHGALSVNGIVLTKLDGTAKGGVIIGITDGLKVPVRYVGIGEAIGDLKPFDAREFVDALFE